MLADFVAGQRVRISQSADNARGMIGRVVKVGMATCDVQVGPHLMTFLFEELRPLKDESAERATQPIQN